MHSFLSKFGDVVRGVLSGFDRLFFRGTLRGLAHTKGLQHYLWAHRIPYKDFAQHSLEVTARLEEASLRQANQLGRDIRYLNSSQVRKEDIAKEIAARDRIKEGLICVLRSVDPCMSFQINKSRATGKLEIHYRQRKCLHLSHYQIHPVFGFMHARIQTWFPFTVYVCINGREWLARQMDQAGLHYQRRDNTFTWLQDIAKAQALFDQQAQANWPSLLGGLIDTVNPAHADIFAKAPCRYYWSVADSEWASDVMFTSRAALQEVYPQLVRYAITTFGAVDVLRFLGQPVVKAGKVPHRCRHEVTSNVSERVEGVRVKHWVNQNSVKLYDKDSVLRAGCTLRQPGDFKVYRPAEGDPDGVKEWRPLRKGIADLHRRAEVSQAANERYLQALAAVHDTTPVRELAEPLCRPAAEPVRRRGSTTKAAATAASNAGSQQQGAAAAAEDNAACNGGQATRPATGPEAAPLPSGADGGVRSAAAGNNAVGSGGPQTTEASAAEEACAGVEPCGVAERRSAVGPASMAACLVTAVVACAVTEPRAAEEPCVGMEPCAAVVESSDVNGTDNAPEGYLVEPCAAVVEPSEAGTQRRRVRALNPLGAADAALLEAVSRHESLINGLRNRDLRRLLCGGQAATAAEERRRAAATTRQLRLLRAHRLIRKVPRTHRYMVSEAGRRAITALLAARNACAEELIRCAG